MNNNNNIHECNNVIEVKIEENENGIDANIELPIIITSSASCCSDTDLLSQPHKIATFNNETSFISYSDNSSDQLSFMRSPSPSNLNASGTSRGVGYFRFFSNSPQRTQFLIVFVISKFTERTTMVTIAEQWREGQTTKSNKNDKLYAVQIAEAYVSQLSGQNLQFF